jgi:type I restriction enzyme S subunit
MEVKPGYKRTEVGVIPEDWEVQTIGEAMKLVNGRAFKLEDWKQHGIPIIRIQNLNDPNGAYNYCTTPIEERHRVTTGDVLFAWSGTTGTSFGARIWGGPTGVLNQHIFKVIADEQKLTSVYSFLILQRVQEDIEKQAHGFKASFVHVKKSDLVKVWLPVPPLPEQHAIAEALSDVDGLLGSLDLLIAKKSNLKQAAMQQLLTGQTRLAGFHSKWEVKRIADIGSPSSDKNNTGETLPVLTCSKHFGFVDSLGFFKNQVFSKDLSTYKIIRRGQIGYPANHVEEGSIGLQDLYDIALVSPIYVVFSVGEGVNSLFLHRVLKLDSYRQKFKTATTSSVDRRGSLRWPAFSKITVSLPSLPEQNAITKVLADIDAELAALKQRRDKTRALKQAMMQELLTGKTRLVSPRGSHA